MAKTPEYVRTPSARRKERNGSLPNSVGGGIAESESAESEETFSGAWDTEGEGAGGGGDPRF